MHQKIQSIEIDPITHEPLLFNVQYLKNKRKDNIIVIIKRHITPYVDVF